MGLQYAFMVCVVAVVLTGAASAQQPEADIAWHEATDFVLEGQGWTGVQRPYHRLPYKAHDVVRQPVWDLSVHSAGLAVRFTTDAPAIHANWKLSSDSLAMNHMAATGVSGLDLYVREGGRWRWLGVGRPTGQETTAALISGLPSESREYMLYLPLYNGVTSVRIGVPPGNSIRPAPMRLETQKPVVFYGTSITQGGCATRPGMAYPAIVGRMLDLPTINLGFSGNGRSEPEMVDLLAELDPGAYVIDPLPNMGAEPVEERIKHMLNTLRQKRPGTPVIMVESAGNQNDWLRLGASPADLSINQTYRRVYEQLAPEWDGRLFYVEGTGLVGDDGEGTVDGVHATDLGFLRMAEKLVPVIREALQ